MQHINILLLMVARGLWPDAMVPVAGWLIIPFLGGQ